jgi:type I restriction enzyme R subunit
MSAFTESVVEEAAVAWLEANGWHVAHGPQFAPDTTAADRRDVGKVVLARRQRVCYGLSWSRGSCV